MAEKKQGDLSALLGYAGERKSLTFLGLALSAVAMALSMVPYICVWLVVRDLVAVAPDWSPVTAGWRSPSRWRASSCTS